MSSRLYPGAFIIAVLAAARGHRSGSLDRSGAAAAALLGYSALANPLSVFGVCLLGFYLAGSRATKVKTAIKATYEEPEHGAATVDSGSRTTSKSVQVEPKSGGNRSATQVACNALLGTACAVTWRYLYSGEIGSRAGWTEEGKWCVAAGRNQGGEEETSRVLVIAAVAFWAACCGDTFASEVGPALEIFTLQTWVFHQRSSWQGSRLKSSSDRTVLHSPQLGILSSRPPILITTLRPCPRGTNGGISAWGTLVSLLGGVLVGALAVISLALQGQATACGGQSRYGSSWWWAMELLLLGGLCGLGGSMVDSLLGGVFQPTYFSKTRSLVVHSPEPSKTHPDDEIVRVPGSGWDVVSNNAVNAISTLLTAAGAAWYASRW